MANTHDFLKNRFACVRQDLDQVLDRLDDTLLPWAPRSGMPTIVALLLEIANKERETLVWVQAGVWPDDGPDAFEPKTATLGQIRLVLAQLRTETYAFMDSLSGDDIEELIDNPERWWEALRVSKCPVSEVFRNIAAHEWYHTAQLTTYLWMRGDDPSAW